MLQGDLDSYIRMPAEQMWTADALDEMRAEIPYRAEVLDGVLFMNPSTNLWHSDVIHSIRNVLLANAPDGMWAYCGAEIRSTEDYIVRRSFIPDITVAPRRLRDEPAYFAVPNDVPLVIEVVSPGSEAFDRRVRPGLYAELGIPSMWRIEEGPKLVEYRLTPDGGTEVVQTVTTGVFTTDVPFRVSIDVDALH